MRRLLILTVLTALSCPVYPADSKYLQAGAPATDRDWRGSDYRAFVELVAAKRVPLPRFEDTDGAEMLKRFCSNENLELGRNTSLPLPARLDDFLQIQQYTGQLTKLYMAEAVRARDVSAEMTALLSFMLETAALGIELVEELLPTIPKDETYEIRMEGLRRMKRGTAEIFLGAYQSIAHDAMYSDTQRSQLLLAAAATSDRFATILPTDTRTELATKFKSLQERFKSAEDRRSIETIVSNFNKG